MNCRNHNAIRRTVAALAGAGTLLFSSMLSAQSVKSESNVNWIEKSFDSVIILDVTTQAVNTMPGMRNAASRRVETVLPSLIKDPLLSLKVDSANTLGDILLQNGVTLEQITGIISAGKSRTGIFNHEMTEFSVTHQFSLDDIGSLLVKHNNPYTATLPIETVSSREYTGILIDCRGTIPVQGEFVSDRAVPCFFPKIWDDTMELLYERNMMYGQQEKDIGMVAYGSSDDISLYFDRIGKDPLRISARKVFGTYRTDPVISRRDALRILSVPANLELLKQGKVVILLDEDLLVHPCGAPEKTRSYYTSFRELEIFHYEKKIDKTSVSDEDDGIHISIEDINFVADSAQLLDNEEDRLRIIAEKLVEITAKNEYTLLVEGHTASVGKPEGEMNLSFERAQAIIDKLTEYGVDPDLCEAQGFGGTKPIGDNSTEEGRERNRRVEIIVRPKVEYVQRIE